MIDFKILREEVSTSSFRCESKPLEDYIKYHALNNQRLRIAKCVVALKGNDLVGYYTTSNHMMEKESLARSDTRGLPGYPIPTLLLGKLAVHKEHLRQGIGSQLLRHLFLSIVDHANKSLVGGFRFVVLDTKEAIEGADQLDLKYGFKYLPAPNNTMMYIKTTKIIKAARSG